MMNNDYYVYGIDPGSNKAGIAIFHLNDNLNIIGLESYLDKLDKRLGYTEPLKVTVRLSQLASSMKDLFNYRPPSAIGIESSFSNGLTPGAVVPLAKTVGTIERIVEDSIYKDCPLIMQSPKAVKKILAGTGDADKDDMRIAFNEYGFTEYIDMNTISEDEIDAIAIAYGTILKLREGAFLL